MIIIAKAIVYWAFSRCPCALQYVKYFTHITSYYLRYCYYSWLIDEQNEKQKISNMTTSKWHSLCVRLQIPCLSPLCLPDAKLLPCSWHGSFHIIIVIIASIKENLLCSKKYSKCIAHITSFYQKGTIFISILQMRKLGDTMAM